MARPTPGTTPLNIKGTKGNDTLEGGALGDTINGGAGNDTLIGNGGADTLTGGTGADTFKYLAFGDSRASSGVDRITDFSAAAGDKLDLTALGTATLQAAFNASFNGLQAVFAYNAQTNTTTLSYYQGSGVPVLQVDFTGNVSYTQGAFLGIVEPPPPPTDTTAPTITIDETIAGDRELHFKFTSDEAGTVSVQIGDRVYPPVALTVGQQDLTIQDLDPSTDYVVTFIVTDAAGNTRRVVLPTITTEAPTTVSIADATASEDASEIVFSLTRSGDLHEQTTVLYTASDGRTGSVTFAAGAATASIAFLVADDNIVGNGRAFTVTIEAPGIIVEDGVAVGTILDDEAPTEGEDNLSGTAGDDTVDLLAGNDIYDGQGGSDTIIGGAGDDTLSGGDGDDILRGGTGADALNGGNGFDTADYSDAGAALTIDVRAAIASGSAQGDTFDSIERFVLTAAADTFRAGASAVTVLGGRGRDFLTGGDGADTLDGGDDHDILVGGLGADSFIGGAGIDRVHYSESAIALQVDLATGIKTGAAAGDTYSGIEIWALTNLADRFIGSGAAEQIEGEGGNDFIAGGAGDDALIGGAGNDFLAGEDGNDVLLDHFGDDELNGGDGDDLLNGGTGNDDLGGGQGNDTLAGEDGDDELLGQDDEDTVYGGTGNDTIYGGDGHDILYGNEGDDFIDGGVGSDTIYAGPNSGNGSGDTISVADAFDAGADRVIFLADWSTNASRSKITGFDDAEDKLDLSLFAAGKMVLVSAPVGTIGTLVQVDTNGNGLVTDATDFAVVLEGVHNPLGDWLVTNSAGSPATLAAANAIPPRMPLISDPIESQQASSDDLFFG